MQSKILLAIKMMYLFQTKHHSFVKNWIIYCLKRYKLIFPNILFTLKTINDVLQIKIVLNKLQTACSITHATTHAIPVFVHPILPPSIFSHILQIIINMSLYFQITPIVQTIISPIIYFDQFLKNTLSVFILQWKLQFRKSVFMSVEKKSLFKSEEQFLLMLLSKSMNYIIELFTHVVF